MGSLVLFNLGFFFPHSDRSGRAKVVHIRYVGKMLLHGGNETDQTKVATLAYRKQKGRKAKDKIAYEKVNMSVRDRVLHI